MYRNRKMRKTEDSKVQSNSDIKIITEVYYYIILNIL